jgi:hypothetical protein
VIVESLVFLVNEVEGDLVSNEVVFSVDKRGQKVGSALRLVELDLAVGNFVVVEILRVSLALFKYSQKVLENLMAEVLVSDCAVSQLEGVSQKLVVLSRVDSLNDHVGASALQGDANSLLVFLLLKAVVEHTVDDAFLLFKLVGLGDEAVGRIPVLVVVLLNLHVLVQAFVQKSTNVGVLFTDVKLLSSVEC